MDAFQDVLKQAADIKSAQLKERPGRQDWERSPDWIKYTAYADKQVEAARAAPLTERLELCRSLKDAGNTEYEAEDAEGALQLYTKALSLFVWFDRGKDRAKEDIPYVNSVVGMEEGKDKTQVNGMVAALFNNASSCLIKMDKHDAAAYAASKALDHDPYNVKALYRRAAAQRALGTSAGLEAAVKDLQKAQALEPDNTQVRSMLATSQRELLDQNRKDAAIYGNMFSRGQLYDDHDTTPQGAGGMAGGTEAQPAEEAIGRDKSLDPSPQEVARALRGMQHGMQAAQARGTTSQQQRGPSITSNTWRDNLAPFTFLPWWAWVLITLHLLYRIAKLWRLPVPGVTWPSIPVRGGQRGNDWQDELKDEL